MKEKFLSIFKIRLIYVATTLFLVVLSFFVFRQLKHLISASHWVNHTTHVSLELEKIIGSLKDAEAGHRGYLLTHDSSFLKSFHQGLQEYPAHIKILSTLTADNPTQQKNIKEIERLGKQRVISMFKLLTLDEQRKLRAADFQFGKTIMDSLKAQINIMNDIETRLLEQRNLTFEKQTLLTPLFILVISLLALGTLMLSYYRISNALTQSQFLQKQQQLMVMEAPAIICMMSGPKHVYTMANEQYMKLIGHRNIIGKPIREALPELEGQGFFELLDEVFTTGKTRSGDEAIVRLEKQKGIFEDSYMNFIYRASINSNGEIEGVLVYGLEVTDQVLTRKGIEESESQLRIALEGGELGTFDFNLESNQLTWSAKTKEFFGLDPDSEIDYDQYINALHPEDREKSRLIIEGVILSQKKDMYELEYRTNGTKDGKMRWLRSKGKALFDTQGKPVRISGIVQDVTQRKLAEEILKESEERFRTLVMSLPTAVYSCDARGRITFYNHMAVTLWGRAPVIGEDLWCGSWKIFNPDGTPLPLDSCPMAIALKEGKASMGKEIVVERPDGTRATVLAHPLPQFGLSGEVTGAINTLIDITSQLNAIKAVKESESRFRLLAETLPQLVWVTDEKGLSEYTSRRWSEYSGIVPNGEKEWKAVVFPDDYININNTWINSLTTGTTYKSEVRLKSKTGEYRWHAVYGEPILNSEKQIIKWVGSFTDIHSEKTFSQQLEKEVKERTNELALKNIELEKINKELEAFNYISSHDLQEPLRKIQTFSSRIMDTEKENLSEAGKDYFRRMQAAAVRMQSLIEDLLAFSRTSNAENKFEYSSLNEIVAEVEADLKETITEKNAIINVAKLCKINIIPFQFRQLMHNLIGNSLKFSKKNTPPYITIDSKKISSQEVSKYDGLNDQSQTYLLPNKNYCVVTVKDNGIGFESRFKDKIFEVFQRLHERNEYAGTGIGLAIVKKIVDNHRGFIITESELNEGTSFKIYIPETESIPIPK